MRKTAATFNLDESVKVELEMEAARQRRPQKAIVEEALRDYFKFEHKAKGGGNGAKTRKRKD